MAGDRSGQRKNKQSARFAITVWWIWKWRNNHVFNGTEVNRIDKIMWLTQQFKDIESVLDRVSGPRGRRAQDNRRRNPWKPPKTGWIKVNTDGSASMINKTATCGGVLRDETAKFMGAFSKQLGSCGALEAELWGIYHGFKKAWNSGYRKVIFEVDCAMAMNLIERDNNYDGPGRNLVEMCRTMKDWNWEVWLRHIPREQNKVADMITNEAFTDDAETRVFETATISMQRYLREDEIGMFGASNTARITY